jgi:predicted DNA binding CopG/RHH family protein
MTRKKTAKTTTIPKFKSEAEEAAWWDAHPDFIVEQFEKAAKEGRLLRGIPKSKSVTIRIPMRDLEAAQRLADRKGLPYQTYMKMLLHQALEKERVAR